jgi:hypothetical protein
MMKAAENRPRHDPGVLREFLSGQRASFPVQLSGATTQLCGATTFKSKSIARHHIAMHFTVDALTHPTPPNRPDSIVPQTLSGPIQRVSPESGLSLSGQWFQKWINVETNPQEFIVGAEGGFSLIPSCTAVGWPGRRHLGGGGLPRDGPAGCTHVQRLENQKRLTCDLRLLTTPRARPKLWLIVVDAHIPVPPSSDHLRFPMFWAHLKVPHRRLPRA